MASRQLTRWQSLTEPMLTQLTDIYAELGGEELKRFGDVHFSWKRCHTKDVVFELMLGSYVMDESSHPLEAKG